MVPWFRGSNPDEFTKLPWFRGSNPDELTKLYGNIARP